MKRDNMKINKVSFFLLSIFLFYQANCFSSACNDSLYSILSQLPIDSMSQNEALYYSQMKVRCEEENQIEQQKIEQKRQEDIDDRRREAQAIEIRDKAGTAVVTSCVGIIIITIIIIAITNAKINDIKKSTQQTN